MTVDGEAPLALSLPGDGDAKPVELEGTFPLPEAQVDRFLMRVGIGYPQREEERQILRRFRADNPLERLTPLIDTEALRQANLACRQVHVHPVLEDYILDLTLGTRQHADVELGASRAAASRSIAPARRWPAARARLCDPRRRAGVGYARAGSSSHAAPTPGCAGGRRRR